MHNSNTFIDGATFMEQVGHSDLLKKLRYWLTQVPGSGLHEIEI